MNNNINRRNIEEYTQVSYDDYGTAEDYADYILDAYDDIGINRDVLVVWWESSIDERVEQFNHDVMWYMRNVEDVPELYEEVAESTRLAGSYSAVIKNRWLAEYGQDYDAEVELRAVMTTSEAEAEFGLAEGTANKACQRGDLRARKSGGTWLIRRQDALDRWGGKARSLALLLISLALTAVIWLGLFA